MWAEIVTMTNRAGGSVKYITEPMAYWLAVSGIIVQAVLTAALYASPIWVGDSNLLMLAYTIVVLSIGFVGIFWLRSESSGKIKFGSLLVIISAVMSFTTMWGLITGSGLMLSGGALAIASVHPVMKIPRWSEIISR